MNIRASRSIAIPVGMILIHALIAVGFVRSQDAEPLVPGLRAWKSSKNPTQTFDGVLVSANANRGVFSVPSRSGSNQEYDWQYIQEPARLLAQIAWLDKDDAEQYLQVSEHLTAIQQAPSTVSVILKTMHRQKTSNPFLPAGKRLSPYAGLWSGVALSAGDDRDPENAIQILKQVIIDITEQQKISAERHRMTLASAYNNLGICYIKTHNANNAAAQFINAITASRTVPAVIRHNAIQLSEIGADAGKILKLSDAQRRKLATTIGANRLEGSQVKLPRGWLHSIDFSVPPGVGGAIKYQGIDAPLGGMEIVSIGAGVVVAPETVMTSAPVVVADSVFGPKLVTVVEPIGNDVWRSAHVSRVSMEPIRAVANAMVATETSHLFGVNVNSAYTSYTYIQPQAGHPSGELAALSVPGLKTKSGFVSRVNAKPKSEIKVLGFERAADLLQKGVQSTSGRITSENASKQEIDARVEGGNLGGAVIDAGNTVCGIAFASDGKGGGRIFPIEVVRAWLNLRFKTSKFPKLRRALRRRTVTIGPSKLRCRFSCGATPPITQPTAKLSQPRAHRAVCSFAMNGA